jgi:hypothetical protein
MDRIGGVRIEAAAGKGIEKWISGITANNLD